VKIPFKGEGHPRAEAIHDWKKDVPAMSLATVYKNEALYS